MLITVYNFYQVTIEHDLFRHFRPKHNSYIPTKLEITFNLKWCSLFIVGIG